MVFQGLSRILTSRPKVKVSYTGTWDLLHVGHIRALEIASTFGDELWVGVVSDEWATSYKDIIIPAIQRAETLAALRCVDYVFIQKWWDSDVDFLIENGFSIKAAGPCYTNAELHPLQRTGRERLEAAGIEIAYVPRTSGISTSIIKRKVRNYEETPTIVVPDVPIHRLQSFPTGGGDSCVLCDPG